MMNHQPGLEAAMAELAETANGLGLSAPQERQEQLARWAGLIIEWRRPARLTAVTSAEEVIRDLMLPALHAVCVAPVAAWHDIVDFGCGNGATGASLAACIGHGTWYLVESDAKKVVFCRYAVDACRIPNMKVLSASGAEAEGLQGDVILARAVPRTGEMSDQLRRMAKPGGRIVRWLPEREGPRRMGAVRCGGAPLWVVAESVECFT